MPDSNDFFKKKGVGNKGWQGDKAWRENVKKVSKGGDIQNLNKGIPSKEQAVKLINDSGGRVIRIEGPHGGLNPHTYNHINYIVKVIRGTIRIL